jgi:hypothetical protein
MRILSVITEPQEVRKILRHLVKIGRSPPGLHPPSSNKQSVSLPPAGSHSSRPACAAILRGAHFSAGDMLWIGGSAAVMTFVRRATWMARNCLDRYGF